VASILRHMLIKLRNQAIEISYSFFKPVFAVSLSPSQRLFLKKCCTGYLLLISLIFLADKIWDSHLDKSMAYLEAQDFVSEHLVRPYSAEFPPRSASGIEVEYLGGHRYLVSGYLDSLNTFGNIQRSSYTAIIRYVGAGEWVDEKITFEQSDIMKKW
jgi:hypothetical protein